MIKINKTDDNLLDALDAVNAIIHGSLNIDTGSISKANMNAFEDEVKDVIINMVNSFVEGVRLKKIKEFAEAYDFSTKETTDLLAFYEHTVPTTKEIENFLKIRDFLYKDSVTININS